MTTTLDDLKAPIEVIFEQIVANKIKMGDKGRMLFLYKNTEISGTYRLNEYKSAVLDLTDEVLEKYVKQLFKGGCKKVIVLEYKGEISNVVNVMAQQLNNFDWLCSVDSDAQSAIVAWAKENERFAMTYNVQADSIYIASIANPSAMLINDDGTTSTITGYQLIPVLAGVACGCPYNMSITYKVFDELKEVTQPSAYNESQITLYPEEEGIRVANPVNTLQTLNSTQTEDMKKLTIAEGMQRIKQDLKKAFRLGYKGKYKNYRDNQELFYAAVKYGYIRKLIEKGIEILDNNYANNITTDVETQREAWLERGKAEAANWDDETVKNNTISDMVYAIMDVKMLDAMEGMKIRVQMF